MTAPTLDFENGRYMVDGWRGVAFYLTGWDQKWEPFTIIDEDEDGNEYEWVDDSEGEWVDDPTSGRVRAVMVGDDYEHVVDVSDLVSIDDNKYCSECGQIGCSWGAS